MKHILLVLLLIHLSVIMFAQEKPYKQSILIAQKVDSAVSSPYSNKNLTNSKYQEILKNAQQKDIENLQEKDKLTLIISSAAFLTALVTFAFNVYQKGRDNDRAFRKELTDIMKELVEVNIAFAKLDHENLEKPLTNALIGQKRNLNSRRRYLIEHSKFLIEDKPNLVSDADYSILAGASSQQGYLEESEEFYKKAISSSKNTFLRAVNTRGYARFLFESNRKDEARNKYIEVIENLSENQTDFYLDAKVDTFMLWAILEFDFGDLEEADRLFRFAIHEANNIQLKGRREYVQKVLQKNFYLLINPILPS